MEYITVQRMGQAPYKVKNPVQKASETVQEGVRTCPEYFRNVSQSSLKRVQGRHRTARSTRKAEKQTPYNSKIGNTLAAVVFSAGIGGTYYNIFWKYQITLYALGFALGVWFDFLGIAGRKLAPQTRKIIAGLTVLYLAELFTLSLRLGEVLAIITLLASILVKKLNAFWLDSYNWQMSPEVINTIANAPDNMAAKAWQDRGKREMRALLLSLGYEITENDLDGTFQAPYKLGYMNGFQKTEQHRTAVNKAQEQAEEYIERAETAEQQLKECIEANKTLMKEYKEIASKYASMSADFEQIRSELAAVREENARLMNDNGALVSMIDEPEAYKAAGDILEESAEERARELLVKGYSVRKTAELTGLNKTKVGNIRLELKAIGELQEATETKVVSIMTA